MSQIWLVPAFPLLGFILNGFLGKCSGTRFVTFVGPLAIALSFAQSLVLFFQMLEVVEEVGSITLIGRLLFTDYILSFEIIAILLLVAVIGAVVIAKRRFQ